MRIRNQLSMQEKPEKSKFMICKSTVDHILSLCVGVERRRESRQGMLETNVDFSKCCSVHYEALLDPCEFMRFL